jgi:dolichol-phosphate mannosyltransferase
MQKHDTLVAIATYNEIENLPRLVEDVFRYARDVDVLVVDDNSPDGTGRWCDEKSALDRRVRCLHRNSKRGLGTAVVAAMRYAIDRDYQYLINMDGDFSHHPRQLPEFRAKMHVAANGSRPDVVIGSRYVPGGAVTGWPLHRRWMSRGVNAYARSMLGLKTKDCSGAYRCYRVSTLGRLDFDALRSRGYSFYEEILWHLQQIGASMAEIPIEFADRQRGQSKINSAEALNALRIIFSLGLRSRFGR